jgi:hypothetical protein
MLPSEYQLASGSAEFVAPHTVNVEPGVLVKTN